MAKRIFKSGILLTFLLFSLVTFVQARSDDGTVPGVPAATPSSETDDASGSSTAPAEGPLSRWLEVDALSFSIRYRNSFDTDGVHVFDDYQQRSLFSGKVKLDKQGKYFIGFRAESGRYFNWSYASFSGLNYGQAVNNAVAAMSPQRQAVLYAAYYADPQGAAVSSHIMASGWQFYVRDLYLSATPVKGLTLEYGAIPIERGVGTEITTYDEDGYITGERVRAKYPKQLYLDQIEFTSAYLGDVFTPNFFDRYDRLDQWNYRQILGEKHFGKRLKASVDYTWLAGTHTVREALLVNTHETGLLDSARVELYQRTNDIQLPGYFAKAANGWAFTGTKRLSKRVTIEGGFAGIDQSYGVYSGSSTLAGAGFSLNGDSYQVGDRFFGRTNVKVLPGTSLFAFYTHQINSKPNPIEYSFVRQNFNFGMQLDFKAMLQRAHLL
jgi:hypothetical protein